MTMSDYLVVCCLLPTALEEELPEILAAHPILGCRLQPASPDRMLVEVYLDDDQSKAAAFLAHCLEESGGEQVVLNDVAMQDWLASYRSMASPFPVGRRWWMDPHPDSPTPAPPGRTRLVIEPRMAFGTGSHESTQLILLELEALHLSGRSVLDVGTGSAVLALAAESLGAASVVGLDVDAIAVWVARQNVQLQEWGAAPVLVVGPIHCLGRCRFDLVLCNMIPEQFLPLLDRIRCLLAPGGEAVFSGILTSQESAVAADIEAAGLEVTGRRCLDEWLAIRAGHG